STRFDGFDWAENRVFHVGLSLVAPRPRPLSVRVPAFWRLACMLAEGRNGWAPSGYRKKTRTGINQQVPHAHSSRAVARRGARSGPGLWWACVGAEGDLGGLG